MLLSILGFSLFSLSLHAQSYRMTGNYYVRSSANFNDTDENRVGVLAIGSTFTVLQKKIIGKSEALQIRVTSLPPPGYVKLSKEYWVYKPNDKDFIQMAAADKTDTEGKSIQVPCADCTEPVQQATASNTKNTGDIADISLTITARQNQAPAAVTPPPPAEMKPGTLDETIKKYSDSDEVKHMIDYALKHKKSKSQGYCYRSVKKALLAAPKGKKGLISDYPGDRAALMAKTTLKKYGFVNLLETEPYKTQMKSPSQAPRGAVLVYSSGIPCGSSILDCGHTEIKTNDAGKPGFVSDYYSNEAINETAGARRYGTNYKLVGVMIKK